MKITANISHGNTRKSITCEGVSLADALTAFRNSYIPTPDEPGFAVVLKDLEQTGKAARGWVDYVATSSLYPIHLVLSESEAEAVGAALNRARIAEVATLKTHPSDSHAPVVIAAIDRVRAQMESATPPPLTRAADFARAFYLSYANEYLTASGIAEAHGIPESLALALIESGRR